MISGRTLWMSRMNSRGVSRIRSVSSNRICPVYLKIFWPIDFRRTFPTD